MSQLLDLDINTLINELSALKTTPMPSYRPPWSPAVTYKTKMCKSMLDSGNCRYGSTCLFAHSMDELRVRSNLPMDAMRRNLNYKYKTKLCNKYHRYGFCPYGDRCLFVHDPHEVQNGKSKCNCTCEEHQQFHKNPSTPHVNLNVALDSERRSGLNLSFFNLDDMHVGSFSAMGKGMYKCKDHGEPESLTGDAVMKMLSFLEDGHQ
uniref:C3H1-type domain-containing protein n=1 Tax=Steinernema glaseri TaxID=37863 RepID=A0A1I8A384_9BILA